MVPFGMRSLTYTEPGSVPAYIRNVLSSSRCKYILFVFIRSLSYMERVDIGITTFVVLQFQNDIHDHFNVNEYSLLNEKKRCSNNITNR